MPVKPFNQYCCSGIALAMGQRHSGVSTYELMAKGRKMSSLPTIL